VKVEALVTARSLVLLFAGSGCVVDRPADGGQFGEESGAGCKAVSQTPLSGTELSPLGFSADDVARLVVETSAPLVWADGSGTTNLLVQPTAEGAAEYVEYEVVLGDTDGREAAVWCPNLVERPYRLVVQTEDGALDEIWSVRLVSDTVDSARAWFEPEGFAGSLDPWSFARPENGFDAVSVSIALAWSTEGLGGSIWGQGSGTAGENAFAEQFPIAEIGSATP
jgi:hypothetical protein